MSRFQTLAALLTLGAFLGLPGPARASEEEDLASYGDDAHFDEDRSERVRVTAWGGGSSPLDKSGGASGWAGAELGWLFTSSSLSGLFELHRYGAADASRPWTPVALARYEQRFETRRGLEGTLTLGLGAGKPDRAWISWYQLTLGVRLSSGPIFVAGEVGFERQTFFRFGIGAGVSY